MAAKDVPVAASLRQALTHLRHPQHRDTAFLLLNQGAQAVAGLLFWVVLTRALDLAPAAVGVGYAVIALGTIAAVVAKGGLDTALLRHAPRTSRRGADGLLALGTGAGAGVALATLAILWATGAWGELAPVDWALAATIAILLLAMWLQDALFLAEGRTFASALRNLVASVARVLLPFALVLLAIPRLVSAAWALSIAGAALVGLAMVLRLPRRNGPPASRRAFLASATRNLAGGAAEFLPGLLLAPLVLATSGPESAAHFGMAWTIATILFLASSAASRSVLARLVHDPASAPQAIRRAAVQHLALVAPAALAMIALAPWLLGIFGDSYSSEAGLALVLLAASIVAVAPATLYLSLLRARDAGRSLVLYPLAMLGALAVLAPAMAAQWGVTGVAAAWLLANLPFGAYAAVRLHRESKEVTPHVDASAPVGHRAHLE